MSPPSPGLVPVHIGQPEPGSEREQALLLEQRAADRSSRPRLRVPAGLDWQKHGLEPRWLGMETSDCAVAVQPSIFHGRGADELERFLAGARRRHEVALVVAVIGDASDERARGVLSSFDSSIHVNTSTTVSGRRLPAGTRPELAPGLSSADRDLALRLRTRTVDAPWWSLHLSGTRSERADGFGFVIHEVEGELHPILVDALGDPLVAAWTSRAGGQRWYIIPDAANWDNVLGWLIKRALPEYVPNALRRARSPHFADPDLQTGEESAVRQALDELEMRYTTEKQRLDEDLRAAEARAQPIRYGLLYSTGAELVRAVAAVLTAAGLRAVDLDEELGGTRSADLLVSDGAPPARLVEVKGVSGAASERLVDDLQRHLRTWPQLRPGQPVTGGVLIVNHQYDLHPSERTAHVYSRPEFIAALRVTVVSTLDLFRWWRTADWAAIRTAMLGAHPSQAATTAVPTEAATNPAAPANPVRRRWWGGGRRTR
jgi:hypothetical protein